MACIIAFILLKPKGNNSKEKKYSGKRENNKINIKIIGFSEYV